MTVDDKRVIEGLIGALGLPPQSRVDRREPKTLLLEDGAPTAADQCLIDETIDEIQWIATLKPSTIGLAPWQDEQREYLEIAVVAVILRRSGMMPARLARLAELVHRAIPSPVFLVMQTAAGLNLSLAHKRWAQNGTGQVVLDGDPVAVDLPADVPSPEALGALVRALAVTSRPHRTLFDLYAHWMDSLYALRAARLTGTFAPAGTPEQAAARRRALQDCERLDREIASLRTQADTETQIARRVELNLQLKGLQSALLQLRKDL